MSRPRKVWIVTLLMSEEVQAELRGKHALSRAQVEQAVRFHGHASARWHVHRRYGERLIVRGYADDRVELIVYLRAVDLDDGVWECLTAWRLDEAD